MELHVEVSEAHLLSEHTVLWQAPEQAETPRSEPTSAKERTSIPQRRAQKEGVASAM